MISYIPLLMFMTMGLLVSWGVISFWSGNNHPETKASRLGKMFGFEQLNQEASSAGIKFKLQHYVAVIVISIALGAVVGYYTNNFLYTIAGLAVGMIVPRIVIDTYKYNRRRDTLLNIPGNARLLVSKLSDCKSLEKALAMSIPLMTGPTRPIFERLHTALQLKVPVDRALLQIQREIKFKKFDELAEKFLMGYKDGYHARSIQSIRKTIEEITADARLLQEVDMKNKDARMMPYLNFLLCFGFPFLCWYMELQLAEEISQVLTLDTPIGKIAMASMTVTAVIGLWKKDKYLRLNLDGL